MRVFVFRLIFPPGRESLRTRRRGRVFLCPETGRHSSFLMFMSESVCWNCGKDVGGDHFCSSCVKLQPLGPGSDYFSFFELPRKLRLDAKDLESRFYALSRRLHPDNFFQATDEERRASTERTAILNDGYRILKEPVSRATYLLELEGEKVEGSAKQVPPELLEEVFELNEQLAEIKAAQAEESREEGRLEELRRPLEETKKSFEARQEAFYQELDSLSAEWDRMADAKAPQTERRGKQQKIAQLLSKRKYLENLLRDVNEALNPSGMGKADQSSSKTQTPLLQIKLGTTNSGKRDID